MIVGTLQFSKRHSYLYLSNAAAFFGAELLILSTRGIYYSKLFFFFCYRVYSCVCVCVCTVHSAQRALQQLETCRNCSQTGIEDEMPVKSTGVATQSEDPTAMTSRSPSATAASESAISAAAAAAAEILSPEEALPEEMIPDQESPAVQPAVAVIKADAPMEPPVADNSLQQQEHAQQQESENAVSGDLAVFASQPAVPASAQADNSSRPVDETNTTNNNEAAELAAPLLSRQRTVKIQSSDVESVKSSLRAFPAAPLAVASHRASKLREEENPLVITRQLYEPGHVLPPKDVCPDQGEGMKLMVLITTAPSHTAQREAVRSTWGHVAFRRDVGMAFMVGTSKDPRENELVTLENLIYGDIIQVRAPFLMHAIGVMYTVAQLQKTGSVIFIIITESFLLLFFLMNFKIVGIKFNRRLPQFVTGSPLLSCR